MVFTAQSMTQIIYFLLFFNLTRWYFNLVYSNGLNGKQAVKCSEQWNILSGHTSLLWRKSGLIRQVISRDRFGFVKTLQTFIVITVLPFFAGCPLVTRLGLIWQLTRPQNTFQFHWNTHKTGRGLSISKYLRFWSLPSVNSQIWLTKCTDKWNLVLSV